jgi:hypothetical protein
MNVSHLTAIPSESTIRCVCGEVFEVRRKTLGDPHALLELKEKIAGEHKCNRAPMQPEQSKIRVWQAPTSGAQLAHYYSQAMRRLTA